MKVNIDLTKTNPDNDIADEQYTDVGSGAFNLVHDFFYGSTDLEIWTGAGQTGTQLTETTDYTLGGIDSDLTTRAGVNIYSTVTVTNVTYQTGDLYITYHACADFIDAFDRYTVARKYDGTGTGEDILLETDATHASGTGGSIKLQTVSTAGTSGDIDIISEQQLVLNSSLSTAADSVRLYSNNGGIDIKAITGPIAIQANYLGTGSVNGLTIAQDNQSSGTQGNLQLLTSSISGAGADITLTTSTVGGTSGDVVITSGANLTFDDQYTTAAIPFSETGETGLDTTATSIVGAINELAAAGGGSLDDAYNAGSTITVDTTDVDWQVGAARKWRAGSASGFIDVYGSGNNGLIDINNAAGGGQFHVTSNYIIIEGSGTVQNTEVYNGTRTTTNALYLHSDAGGVTVRGTTGVTIDTDQTQNTHIYIHAPYNGSGVGAGLISLFQDNLGTGTGNGIDIATDNTQAGGTGGDLKIRTLKTAGTGGDILINSVEGIDMDFATTFSLRAPTINANLYFDITAAGAVDVQSASNQYMQMRSYGSGEALFGAAQTGNATFGSWQGTGVNSARLWSQFGGIKIDTVSSTNGVIAIDAATTLTVNADDGITIQNVYDGTGTSADLDIRSDVNNAAGTGGDVTVRTTATSGTAGAIQLNSASNITLTASTFLALAADSRMPTAQPGSPAAGSFYFNTTTNVLWIYNGTAWRQIATTA